MALVQHVCFAPLARAVRPRYLAVFSSRNFSIASATRVSNAESQHVLLGMSEQELQQLAVDLDQVKTQKTLTPCLFPEKMKELTCGDSIF